MPRWFSAAGGSTARPTNRTARSLSSSAARPPAGASSTITRRSNATAEMPCPVAAVYDRRIDRFIRDIPRAKLRRNRPNLPTSLPIPLESDSHERSPTSDCTIQNYEGHDRKNLFANAESEFSWFAATSTKNFLAISSTRSVFDRDAAR